MKDNYVYPGHQKGPGMEVRDLFAAHAVQGLLAKDGIDVPCEGVALAAWVTADFMMEMREKTFAERMAIVEEGAGEDPEGDDIDLSRLTEMFVQMIRGAKEAHGENNDAE